MNRSVKYGVVENSPYYDTNKIYWCGGFDLSLPEFNEYWFKYNGIVLTNNLNAAFHYRAKLERIYPIYPNLTYEVREYD